MTTKFFNASELMLYQVDGGGVVAFAYGRQMPTRAMTTTVVVPLLRSSKNVIQVRFADDAESIEDFMLYGLNDPFHVGLKVG
jgi:hypothetical protein